MTNDPIGPGHMDPTEFGPYLIEGLKRLAARGVRQASWTTVYDGDELETRSVHFIMADGHGETGNDDRTDETLLMLARENLMGETGAWILDLENRKLYRTHDAELITQVDETLLATPEETDLSVLDLRTQPERDY